MSPKKTKTNRSARIRLGPLVHPDAEKLNNASVMKRAEIIAMLASRFMVNAEDFEWNEKIEKALKNARLLLEGAIAEAQKMRKIS
jgi:hypothetical protein